MSTIPISVSQYIISKSLEDILKEYKLPQDKYYYGVTTLTNLSQSISMETLAYVLLFLHPGTNTGRFALTFKEQIVNGIHKRNLDVNMISITAYAFKELYDNALLNQNEKDVIMKMVFQEYTTILTILISNKTEVNMNIMMGKNSLYLKTYEIIYR